MNLHEIYITSRIGQSCSSCRLKWFDVSSTATNNSTKRERQRRRSYDCQCVHACVCVCAWVFVGIELLSFCVITTRLMLTDASAASGKHSNRVVWFDALTLPPLHRNILTLAHPQRTEFSCLMKFKAWITNFWMSLHYIRHLFAI